MNFEQEIKNTIQKALGESVRKHLDDYASPLKTMVFDAIRVNDSELRSFIYESVSAVIADESFRNSARDQIKHKVAKELTNSFGEGIFKRSIEQLKSDPLIKARCISAIEKIIDGGDK